MEVLLENAQSLLQGDGWKLIVMWVIGAVLIYLAIAKDMEPSLLLPIGFGAILMNLPGRGAVEILTSCCMKRASQMSCSRSYCSLASVQ